MQHLQKKATNLISGGGTRESLVLFSISACNSSHFFLSSVTQNQIKPRVVVAVAEYKHIIHTQVIIANPVADAITN